MIKDGGISMFKRIVTAILGIPLLILVILLGNLPLLVGTIILTSIGLWELYKAMESQDIKINIIIEIIFNIGLLILMSSFPKYIIPYLVFLFIFHLVYQLFTKEPSFKMALLSFGGIFYISFLFGHILLFSNIPYGKYLIWLVFLIAFSTDTFAYFTGIFLGKNKLCPSISPKKTIEGAIGGIIGSLFVSLLFGLYILKAYDISMSLVHFVVLGGITSVISQLGDLTASSIKRTYGIKDFGNIFPGHGGVLVRFDSILFTAPVVYYYISIFIL